MHFGSPSQNVLKSDLKGPGFVAFRANITHFGPKSDIPGVTAGSRCSREISKTYFNTIFKLMHIDICECPLGKMLFLDLTTRLWHGMNNDVDIYDEDTKNVNQLCSGGLVKTSSLSYFLLNLTLS